MQRQKIPLPGLILLGLWLCAWASCARAESLPGFTEQIYQTVVREYGPAAELRLRRFVALVADLQSKPIAIQLEEVNQFFNQLRFISDQQHWQQTDYWATPLETLATNGGDCEDFAIAKYYSLKQLGVPTTRMRLTYVKAITLNQAHMVLIYYPRRGEPPLVLDNLIDQILPATAREDLVPVYSFNGDGLWKAKQQGDTRLGNADDIVMWRELRARMHEIADR